MRKLIGLVLAASFAFAASSANAWMFKNYQQNGEIEFLGYMSRNVRDLSSNSDDNGRNTLTRITYGMKFDLLENVHANMTLIHGGNAAVRGWHDNEGYWGGGSSNLNEILDAVYLQEAYIVIDDFLGLTTSIGQMFYGDEGDIIVFYGKRHDDILAHEPVDAVKFDYNGDLFGKPNNMHFIYAKVYEDRLSADEDATFAGIKNWMSLTDNVGLGLYVYNRRVGDSGNNDAPDNLWIFGAKSAGKLLGFDYYAEAALNAGKVNGSSSSRTSYTGYALLAKLAYLIKGDFGSFNPRFMYAYGSGDRDTSGAGESNKNFQGINPDFRVGEIVGNSNAKIAGFLYPTQLSNTTVYNIGADIAPEFAGKFSFAIDGINFRQNSWDSGYTDGNHNIGTEVDFTTYYNHSDAVSAKIVAARFDPGSVVNTLMPGANVAVKLASYLSVKFN